ncbi:ABC transporter ATP-binding protein [Luteococcus peritonei]|uniref:ABC transporter ATP-binding protein n=1 Tax=Luteococcus peritonei TaxID=88874 RepID=A0ABW4RTS7_9ACTN
MGIEFEQVAKRYPDGTMAVDDFSLVVPTGRTTVLVGSSGCGKTTLLRMVNRMVAPTSGRVLIDDEDIAGTDPVKLRRRIGYVMQNSGLLPHRRVLDNIATVPRLNGVSRAEAHEQALGLMDLVGLDRSMAKRWPAQLSGGQQQRVGVARALASDPNILLMDEPFGAVDPLVRAELQAWMGRIQAELHKTVLFVTHDIAEALTLGDQIVLLKKGGEVAQVGTPAELVANPADDFVASFLGLDRGELDLHLVEGPHGTLVMDAHGRPAGRISPSPGTGRPA